MHQKIESNKICPVFLGLEILSESSNFFVEFLRISFLKKEEEIRTREFQIYSGDSHVVWFHLLE